ncbi:MAG TPA: 3'-5' exonuclease, partial [Candidatus Obscuribacterales bacterium]
LYEALNKAEIPVFWVNKQDEKSRKDTLAQAAEPVVLSTVHSAKGLEFKGVVLCGLPAEGNDAEANRKLAYVGMTRATDELLVVCRPDYPFLEELHAARAAPPPI